MTNNIEYNWYYHQRYNRNEPKNMGGCFYSLLGVVIIIIVLLSLSGCKTQYIPVETIRTEYQNHTDTIHRTDSIVREKETIIREADSALVAQLGLQLKDNEKAILILKRELERQTNKEFEHSTDTVVKTDSIQVPYPVEKKLSKWEEIKMLTGEVSMVFCLFLVFVVILLMKRKS